MKCNYDIYFNKDKLLNKLNTEKKLVEKFKKIYIQIFKIIRIINIKKLFITLFIK